MRARIIINPTSGQGKAKKHYYYLIEKLRNSIKLDVKVTKNIQDAFDSAKDISHNEFDAVIAAGGDGILNAVINGVLQSTCHQSIPLGYIPLGMSNIAALEIGIPQDPYKACDIIFNGKTSKIDLGKINAPFDRYFISMVDFGFPGYIVNQVETKHLFKMLLGKTGYKIMGGIKIFTFKSPCIKIKIDDKTIKSDGLFLVVLNGKYYGGNYIMNHSSTMTDGKLDLCIFKNKKNMDLVRFIFQYTNQKKYPYENFLEIFSGKKIELESENEVWGQIDGDPLGKLPKEPMTIEIIPQILNIFIP